jgi:hypothetical protein
LKVQNLCPKYATNIATIEDMHFAKNGMLAESARAFDDITRLKIKTSKIVASRPTKTYLDTSM